MAADTDMRQVILGCIILALSINLSVRWDNLAHGCGDSDTKECDKISQGEGALKYCISVGAIALLDVCVWATDAFWTSLPPWVVYMFAQICGGFALGGGSVRSKPLQGGEKLQLTNVIQTLAALINGWNCEKGESADLRLCHQYYADLSLMYVLTIIAWGGLFAWCYAKKHHPPDNWSRFS